MVGIRVTCRSCIFHACLPTARCRAKARRVQLAWKIRYAGKKKKKNVANFLQSSVYSSPSRTARAIRLAIVPSVAPSQFTIRDWHGCLYRQKLLLAIVGRAIVFSTIVVMRTGRGIGKQASDSYVCIEERSISTWVELHAQTDHARLPSG